MRQQDLLPAIDELISTLFGEILLRQKLASSFKLLVGGILMFLRNAVGESALTIDMLNEISSTAYQKFTFMPCRRAFKPCFFISGSTFSSSTSLLQ